LNVKLISLLGNLLKEMVAPPFCCCCGQGASFLCSNCYEQIVFSTTYKKLSIEPLFIDQYICLGAFEEPLKSLILSLKYQGQKEVAVTLAQLIFHTLPIPNADLITAVPAHQTRLLDRGYNQAVLIGQELATLVGVEYADLAYRSKKLVAQATVRQKNERQQRQQNSMALLPNAPKLLHAYTAKTLIIVDDVLTTGATLNETARVIKKTEPAIKVIGLTVAQA
jgi:ComF family protein